MSVAINFASFNQLQTIPSVKARLAQTILLVRENNGNITLEVLNTLTRGKIAESVMADIDFTFNVALETEEDDTFLGSLASTVKKQNKNKTTKKKKKKKKKKKTSLHGV